MNLTKPLENACIHSICVISALSNCIKGVYDAKMSQTFQSDKFYIDRLTGTRVVFRKIHQVFDITLHVKCKR